MNQIAMMFMESNARMKTISKGGYNLEQMFALQREFYGQVKLVHAVVSMYNTASKNKRAMAGFEKMNLLDDSTAIDVMFGDQSEEKVKCPCHEELITRDQCLDYYSDHPEDCCGCETGTINKDKLLGKRNN